VASTSIIARRQIRAEITRMMEFMASMA
jgi:hypothetical protein